jgi:predicted anti-sigma-YlaC factor YlaD
MRCDTFLDRWDALDVGEEPDLRMKFHLATCGECRLSAPRVAAAIEAYRTEAPADEAGELADERIMTAVRLLPKPKRELRARDWAISGLVIVASMMIIPFDQNSSVIKDFFGASYALPLFLVLGIALAGFGAVFIGTHMDELEPFVRRHLRRV